VKSRVLSGVSKIAKNLNSVIQSLVKANGVKVIGVMVSGVMVSEVEPHTSN
jgi:hypothetical protein